MKKLIFACLLIAIVVINACTSNKKSPNDVMSNLSPELREGLTLLENNCYVCHSPTASEKSRLAPPMIAIKKHYVEEQDASEAQFVQEFTSFVLNPTEEKSKMPGAVRRFGLMQKMNFSEIQLEKMAKAIYHTDIPQPDWFEEHYKQRGQGHGKRKQNRGKTMQNSEIETLQQGKKLAIQTKGVLGSNLLSALQEKGTDGALTFCSTRAIHLTDSMANQLNATIKRVSDQNRNPDNQANEEERNYILQAKTALAAGQEIQPKLSNITGKSVGYYPIITSKMCLQCHGEKDIDIKASTWEKIKTLYPNDKATGYGENELRGIWVVEFNS